MSEVINWFRRDTYVIFGASVFDGDFDTWARKDTLEGFLDAVADSWELHFDKDNMPRNGGQFAYFQLDAKAQSQWMIQDWGEDESAAFLSELLKMITFNWQKQWKCGFGHMTSEAFYEVKWRRYNV